MVKVDKMSKKPVLHQCGVLLSKTKVNLHWSQRQRNRKKKGEKKTKKTRTTIISCIVNFSYSG